MAGAPAGTVYPFVIWRFHEVPEKPGRSQGCRTADFLKGDYGIA